MLPIYISYFAGGGERSNKKTLKTALGFVLGFTLIFVAMGALAGSIGSLFTKHQNISEEELDEVQRMIDRIRRGGTQ